RCSAEMDPCQGEPLPLTSGDADPAPLFAQLGVESIRHVADEVRRVSSFEGCPHVGITHLVRSAQRDRLAYGEFVPAELLSQQAELTQPCGFADRRPIVTVHGHSACGWFDQPEHSMHCGC